MSGNVKTLKITHDFHSHIFDGKRDCEAAEDYLRRELGLDLRDAPLSPTDGSSDD